MKNNNNLPYEEHIPELVKLYKIWPGKNRFFFDGRIMIGPRSDSGVFY
jgi:hypothetical protein